MRSLENFLDEAHLPWVHPDVLGNAENVPLIPSREVSETELGFYFEYRSECLDRVGRSKVTENLLTYDVVLPYSLYHEIVAPAGDRVIDLFYCTPVSQHESLRFMLVARNFALDTPAETFQNFTLAVWEQDRAIVESQQPAEVPADPGAEFHMHGPDGPSMVYRRMLGEMGMAQRGFRPATLADSALINNYLVLRLVPSVERVMRRYGVKSLDCE